MTACLGCHRAQRGGERVQHRLFRLHVAWDRVVYDPLSGDGLPSVGTAPAAPSPPRGRATDESYQQGMASCRIRVYS